MPPRARIERLQERLPEQDSGGILDWMGRHPVLTTVGGLALATGGLALGHHTGFFNTAFIQKWAPWLATAGSFVSEKALTFWNWLLLALGVKSMAGAADRGIPDPSIDPRLTMHPPRGVSPPRP